MSIPGVKIVPRVLSSFEVERGFAMMLVVDLDGSAFERGAQQGELMREKFGRMLEEFFSSDLWMESRPLPLPVPVVKLALGLIGNSRTKKAVEKRLPFQAERVRGLARGLRVSEGLAWGVHFLEIVFCEAGKSLKAPVTGGCTQVHAAPKATAAGGPLTGRNYDFPNLLRGYQIVRRDVPAEKDRLATTTVTQVPLAGAHMGVNEAGLAVAANNARLWKGKDLNYGGVPYLLILQEILETCRTTAEGVEKITKFPARANSGFFGLMDAGGDCRLVEFTASRFAVRAPDEAGVLAQANHYIAMPDANLPDGTCWTVKGMEGLKYADSTTARRDTADRLLRESAGKITVETIKSILRDHSANGGVGSDCTVCCHGHSGSSLASMVVDVRERAMWVAEGNPCENEYQKVEFRGIK